MNTAVIGIGSNIQPEKNIPAAREILKTRFDVLKESRFIKTPPQGNSHQSEFINGEVLLRTELSQQELRLLLKEFEQQLGRTQQMHFNQPRLIDFDIHVWNNEVVDPHFHQWEFIRNLVLEVLPELQS